MNQLKPKWRVSSSKPRIAASGLWNARSAVIGSGPKCLVKPATRYGAAMHPPGKKKKHPLTAHLQAPQFVHPTDDSLSRSRERWTNLRRRKSPVQRFLATGSYRVDVSRIRGFLVSFVLRPPTDFRS